MTQIYGMDTVVSGYTEGDTYRGYTLRAGDSLCGGKCPNHHCHLLRTADFDPNTGKGIGICPDSGARFAYQIKVQKGEQDQKTEYKVMADGTMKEVPKETIAIITSGEEANDL